MKGCSFIKKRGWCTRRKSTFETRCRKTCGFCGKYNMFSVIGDIECQACIRNVKLHYSCYYSKYDAKKRKRKCKKKVLKFAVHCSS